MTDTTKTPAGKRPPHDDDDIDESLEESFPASDPPSFNPPGTNGPKPR